MARFRGGCVVSRLNRLMGFISPSISTNDDYWFGKEGLAHENCKWILFVYIEANKS